MELNTNPGFFGMGQLILVGSRSDPLIAGIRLGPLYQCWRILLCFLWSVKKEIGLDNQSFQVPPQERFSDLETNCGLLVWVRVKSSSSGRGPVA